MSCLCERSSLDQCDIAVDGVDKDGRHGTTIQEIKAAQKIWLSILGAPRRPEAEEERPKHSSRLTEDS